jgi:isopentenyl diphosphate isomerase/L-lactate dehydrogenase-like FMN-dependent dehydrogenase
VTPLLNLEDVREAARRRLPRTAFDVIDGGAGDETTVRRNREAFRDIGLRPRALADTTFRDISVTLFGHRVSMPLLLDPCGFARVAHGEGELAAARAAAAAGTIFSLSTATSYPLELVAGAGDAPKWFQLYAPADRAECAALIQRAQSVGYQALAVTIDTAVGGLRERDKRNRLNVPLRMTPRLFAEGARRPRWAIDFMRGNVGRGGMGVVGPRGFGGGRLRPFRSLKDAGHAIAASARPIIASDIEFIRDQWKGPLLVKGVQRGDECDQLIELGVDGIIVSNHGGRQLDTGRATIEILPEVVRAVDGRATVLIDGGFRRGTDVVKALALGAQAVLVGRPYLYGLAVGGEAGVRHVLELLRFEIDQTMALLGCSTVAELDATAVHLRPGFAEGSVREVSTVQEGGG